MTRFALIGLGLLAFASAGCAGEWSQVTCRRGWTIAHPTMTTEGISLGPDARVRQVSEGAKGNIGAGYVNQIDLE